MTQPDLSSLALPESPERIDVEMIRVAFAFLGRHHEEQEKEARRAADESYFGASMRRDCRRVAAHHREQLYLLGEQSALWGFRNPWPSPLASDDAEEMNIGRRLSGSSRGEE